VALCLSLVVGFALTSAGLTLLAVSLAFLHLLPPGIAAELQQPQHPGVFFSGIAVVFAALTGGLMASHRDPSRTSARVYVIGRWRWPLYFWGPRHLDRSSMCAGSDRPHHRAARLCDNRRWRHTRACPLRAARPGCPDISEEFLFRGYVHPGVFCWRSSGPLPAAILSGLLFGALHIPNGLIQTINAVIFGIVCSLIAIRTGGIALTCGIHLANNWFWCGRVGLDRRCVQGQPRPCHSEHAAVDVVGPVPWDIGAGRTFVVGGETPLSIAGHNALGVRYGNLPVCQQKVPRRKAAL